MQLPANKTKIVCTIGPASDSLQMLALMIEAGMNVARPGENLPRPAVFLRRVSGA